MLLIQHILVQVSGDDVYVLPFPQSACAYDCRTEMLEMRCKSRCWVRRCRNICSKFGLIELVNVIWLRDASVNGMVNLRINVEEEVWKKCIM